MRLDEKRGKHKKHLFGKSETGPCIIAATLQQSHRPCEIHDSYESPRSPTFGVDQTAPDYQTRAGIHRDLLSEVTLTHAGPITHFTIPNAQQVDQTAPRNLIQIDRMRKCWQKTGVHLYGPSVDKLVSDHQNLLLSREPITG